MNRRGEKNSNWKGDKVGYLGMHAWVRRNLVKQDFCADCKTRSPYDLANISGKYKRDLTDWEWLCRRCHMLKDGRLKKFAELNIPRRNPEKEKVCPFCSKEFHASKVKIKCCSKSCAMRLRSTLAQEIYPLS